MNIILVPLFEILNVALSLYLWVVIAAVILSWLTMLQVINTKNKIVSVITDILFRLTEPPLQYIRRYIPAFGGLDFSPLILIFGIYFLHGVIHQILISLIY